MNGEYDTQQNHYKNKGHTDNKGDKVTTTTNKFETLVDLTDDKQDGAEKNVERSTSASNIKGEDTTKQWVEATFGKSHNATKITNSRSEDNINQNSKYIDDEVTHNTDNMGKQNIQEKDIIQENQQNTEDNLHIIKKVHADSDSPQVVFTPQKSPDNPTIQGNQDPANSTETTTLVVADTHQGNQDNNIETQSKDREIDRIEENSSQKGAENQNIITDTIERQQHGEHNMRSILEMMMNWRTVW
ncbi:hypothetical protein KY290_031302 [Solanum tuberosum]|uniref:Uncharacterized protein n=1 Tax=Solanum tuberosum TaxID=4113 RepID=A0ABQ7U9K7_SOLTU|nr:hypothetical protein KY290_031302 [Solanum tuberosum]